MSDKSIDRIILACAAVWALVALAACLQGCAPAYTVVSADREVVPVAPQDPDPQGRRVYVEMEDGATGWFVPDSVMLELLEAD